MGKLSNKLLRAFAKATVVKDKTPKTTRTTGTVIINDEYPYRDGNVFVQIDGADDGIYIPAKTTIDVSNGNRVTLTMKNHTAIIDGCTSSPAARQETVDAVAEDVDEAAKTATNFMQFTDGLGLVIGDMQDNNILDSNILLSANGMHIRRGSADVAKFEANEIMLGSPGNSAIKLGNVVIRVENAHGYIENSLSSSMEMRGTEVRLASTRGMDVVLDSEAPGQTIFKQSYGSKNSQTEAYYGYGRSTTIPLNTCGYITNSGTEVRFTFTLPKPVISNDIEVTLPLGLIIRTVQGMYAYGSNGASNPKTYARPTSVTWTLTDNAVLNIIAKMSGTTNVVNNSPCGIEGNLYVRVKT